MTGRRRLAMRLLRRQHQPGPFGMRAQVGDQRARNAGSRAFALQRCAEGDAQVLLGVDPRRDVVVGDVRGDAARPASRRSGAHASAANRRTRAASAPAAGSAGAAARRRARRRSGRSLALPSGGLSASPSPSRRSTSSPLPASMKANDESSPTKAASAPAKVGTSRRAEAKPGALVPGVAGQLDPALREVEAAGRSFAGRESRGCSSTRVPGPRSSAPPSVNSMRASCVASARVHDVVGPHAQAFGGGELERLADHDRLALDDRQHADRRCLGESREENHRKQCGLHYSLSHPVLLPRISAGMNAGYGPTLASESPIRGMPRASRGHALSCEARHAPAARAAPARVAARRGCAAVGNGATLARNAQPGRARR